MTPPPSVNGPSLNPCFPRESARSMLGDDISSTSGAALKSGNGESAERNSIDRNDDVLSFDFIVRHVPDKRHTPSFLHSVSPCFVAEQLGIGPRAVLLIKPITDMVCGVRA
jgi:hypothetical protein